MKRRSLHLRSADGSGEITLSTYAHFADRDALSRVVLERMLAGVSPRRFARLQEPVGSGVEQTARSISKSSVSRAFVERTEQALAELLGRRLDDLRLAVLMIDGIDLKGRTNVVALGNTTDGVKIPLGLREGSTENAAVATAMLSDLVERGLDTSQGVLCVLDGAKALRKAVRSVFGERCPVQRCIRHKERNVLEHLPERDRPAVKGRLRAAWNLDDHQAALGRLTVPAAELECNHPRLDPHPQRTPPAPGARRVPRALPPRASPPRPRAPTTRPAAPSRQRPDRASRSTRRPDPRVPSSRCLSHIWIKTPFTHNPSADQRSRVAPKPTRG